jgi:hypothetical protein
MCWYPASPTYVGRAGLNSSLASYLAIPGSLDEQTFEKRGAGKTSFWNHQLLTQKKGDYVNLMINDDI